MTIGKLEFLPIKINASLLSQPTLKYLLKLNNAEAAQVGVAEINPTYAGGVELCHKYDIDPLMGGNCIIVEATRSDKKWHAACLVPTGSRMDLNGFVRKRLNARRASLAPKQSAIELTGMDYGSINVVGLPPEWPVLIDSTLANTQFVIMGSGLVNSKIAIPGKLLANLPNAGAWIAVHLTIIIKQLTDCRDIYLGVIFNSSINVLPPLPGMIMPWCSQERVHN